MNPARLNRSLTGTFAAVAAFALAARAQHCDTVLVTLSSEGTQGGATAGSGRPAISADGRYVAFLSTTEGLVPNDPTPTGNLGDVYVRDVLAGTIELANVNSDETPANIPDTVTDIVAISGNGRFVAFDSTATNLDLAATDTANTPDVFVRDRLLGTTVRISIAANGTPPNGFSSAPSISADGRYVAFASSASNLVPGDTNAAADVFVKDMLTGAVDRVSTDSNDLPGANGAHSNTADISSDGRYVGFLSSANIGAPFGNPQVIDAFVKDRVTRQIQLVSLASWGEPTNSAITEVRISDDGNRAVFVTTATNLVIQGEQGNAPDVFLRDRAAATTIRITHPATNPFGYSNGSASQVSISDNGRWVAFDSSASDLLSPPIEPAGDQDIFVNDTQDDTFEQASRPLGGGPANSFSRWANISGDGRAIAYLTNATNLFSGDANGYQDVVEFRRDCLPASSFPFCFGDGSGTACPCGNNGFPGNGCASSINSFGANLVGTGLASLTTDTFTLRGSGLTNSVVTYYQGTERTNGGAGAPFGDGLRCAGGTTIRLGSIPSPGGASRYPNPSDLPISVKGAIPAGGGVTRAYQVRYRNSDLSFCTSAEFNLTNGVEATWVP